MPADPEETRLLRELQDAYAWKVNSAISRGREDLAWQLADEYLAEAMTTMSSTHGNGCVRPGCPVCARDSARPVYEVRNRRHGWLWRFFVGG
jgi:hypothetical protein